MSHLDLYATYGLDRSRDPATLAAELDRRIGTSWGEDAEQVNALKTARAVLGDAGRRVLYDRQLDDPSAPPITMADLETLASMPGSGDGSGTGAGFGAGSGGGTGSDDGETAVLPVGGNPYAPAGSTGPAGPVGPGAGFYGQTGPTGPAGPAGFAGQTGGPGGPGVPGYGANPYAPTGGAAPAASTSSSRWILPAVLGVVVVAGIAVAGTWFVMRDDGDSSAAPVAGFTSAPAAPTQDDAAGGGGYDGYSSPSAPSSEAADPSDPFDGLFDDYDDLFDDYDDMFGEVSITGATATSTTCGGRACDRIEITLSGDGEPKIMDGYHDGELQIDIYGVEVAYQGDFPVTDHTDGHHGYITDGVDEYGWPRLRIGASEGTDYTVDNDYTNHHIIVEVYG